MSEAAGALPPEALAHLDALYNTARWLTRDPVEAEDLVQETYLRALRGAHGFAPGTNLRAWLFQILRNTYYTLAKRKGRMPEPQDPETLEGMVTDGARGTGIGGLGRQGDGAAGLDLQAALQRLPEEYRSVVLLADVEDFTMTEVAEIMACPVGTVKSRLFRARALLREQLRDYLRV
ncbi:MAG: sigma-70 family RNA polymerase sigma factor [Candidatus Methylomirabilales bacterium]